MRGQDGRTAGRHDTARRWLAVLPSCLLAVSGCVYFNGVYNAKHWAGQAERSQRAGRSLEAADRWRSAQLHADSVIARHPHSRWTGEAYLIRGRAALELEAYSDAEVALEEAERRLAGSERRREAQLQLGRANLGLHRTRQAIEALDSAALSQDARIRSLAFLYRGRARLAAHRPDSALADFRASRESEARAARVMAALALGDLALAASLADSVASSPAFRESQWTPLLDSLGRAGLPDAAGRLVDALLSRSDVGLGPRARLALGDAERRLAARDSAGARARFGDAIRFAPDSVEARAADLMLLRLDLRAASGALELPRVRAHLARLARQGGQPGLDATALVQAIDLADTLARAPGPSDAWWFFRGEVLRDSLGADALAAATFAEMASRFPDSPWTPKGLLAAVLLAHPGADSLRALLAGRYAASPYAAIALQREDRPAEFALLEDSLRRALATLPGLAGEAVRPDGSRPAGPVPGAPVAGTPQRNAPARPTTRPTIDP